MNATWRGFVWLLRTGAAVIFGWAGWAKLQSPQAFADGIATFRLLPAGWINFLALGLPPMEIILGIWLLCGWKTRTAAFCGLSICAVFLLALVSARIRGLPVECGCFGQTPSSLAPALRLWLSIGRDFLLTGAIALVFHDACRG